MTQGSAAADLSVVPAWREFSVERRQWLGAALGTGALLGTGWLPARAQSDLLSKLTQRDATAGIKAALERGAGIAVDLLGKTDGFWSNDRVRIPLPEWLAKAERALTFIGRGNDVDELKLGVNRAAEQAVPEARTLLVGAVKSMTVQDGKAILTGGENSVTQFFVGKTRAPLTTRFLPIVTKVTDRIGLAQQYNQLAGQAEQLGLVKPDQARIERYVTSKALDGLYLIVGDEERKIRADPVGAGSDILRKVFGAL